MGQQSVAQLQTRCTSEHSVLPVDACDSCTMLSAYAPASSRPGLSKTPVSVTLVVDTSKSMRGHKWEVTIRAVTQAIDMLCEEDLFAIVTYSAEAMILVDSTIATPETKQKARAALEAVKLSRGTNLAAGLLLGLKLQMAAAKADKEQADEPNSQGSSNSHLYRMHAVLLCTDGHPTAGLKTRADILSAQQEVLFPSPEGTARPQDRKARRVLAPVHTHCIPVSQWPSATPARTLWPTAVDWRSKEPSKPNKPFVKVICFGFGEDHNPYLLGDIAMNGGGSYFFVRSPHDVAPAITDSLGGLMTVYASNVTIRISPRHGAVLVGVISGFPQRREGGDISVHMPDMYLREHKDLLVDFRLPECTQWAHSDKQEGSEVGCGCLPLLHRSQGKAGIAHSSRDGSVSMAEDNWVTCPASGTTCSVAAERHFMDASDTSAQTIGEEYSGEFYDASESVSGALRNSSLHSRNNNSGMKRPRSAVGEILRDAAVQGEGVYTTEVAKVTTRFTEVLTGVQMQVESCITVQRAAGAETLKSRPHNPDVTATRLRLQAAIDMHTALRLADDGELSAARGLINNMREQVQAWLQEHSDKRNNVGASQRRQKSFQSRLQCIHSREVSSECTSTMRELAADLDNVAEGFNTRDEYQRVGQKHLYMVSQIHASQRSTTTGLSSVQQSRTVDAPSSATKNLKAHQDTRKRGGGAVHAARAGHAMHKVRHQSTLARVSQHECEWTTTSVDGVDAVAFCDVAATRRSSCLERTPERVRKLLEASGSDWQPPVRTEDLGEEIVLDCYEGASSMLPDASAFVTALGNSFDHAAPCFDILAADHHHPPPSVAYGATAELQARVAGDSGNVVQREKENADGLMGVDGLSLTVGSYTDLGAAVDDVFDSQMDKGAAFTAVTSQPQRQAVLVEQSLKALEGMML